MNAIAKTTHCKRGHERTEANTYVTSKGFVDCRVCRAIASKLWRQKNKTFNPKRNDNYYFNGNREIAIQRDGEKCVQCSLTRQEHKLKYNRDITVDHIDGAGSHTPKHERNNSLDNLQTLCLSCHGRKDVFRRKAIIWKREHKNELTQEEKEVIRTAIGFPTVAAAARSMGITRQALNQRLKKLGYNFKSKSIQEQEEEK